VLLEGAPPADSDASFDSLDSLGVDGVCGASGTDEDDDFAAQPANSNAAATSDNARSELGVYRCKITIPGAAGVRRDTFIFFRLLLNNSNATRNEQPIEATGL
jgi:hypothetical protein